MQRNLVVVFQIIFWGYVLISLASLKAKNLTHSNFLKISYIQTPASRSRLVALKQHLRNNPKRYEVLRDKMIASKIYHSLYIDLHSGEMIAIQDSFSVTSSVSIPDIIMGAHKKANDIINIVEFFQGLKRNYVVPKLYNVWKIDSSYGTRKILDYTVVRAIMSDNPDKYDEIWATMDIQVLKNKQDDSIQAKLYSCTPSYYIGFPGVILEANNVFGSFRATNIEYLTNRQEIDIAIKKFKQIPKKRLGEKLQNVKKSYRVFAGRILSILNALHYDNKISGIEDL